MILSSALLAVMLIMGAGLFALRNHQRLHHYRRMAAGSHYLTLVEKVLEHLPQHRGMANTWLNGDHTFLEKMEAMQQTLEQDIRAISDYSKQQPLHPEIDARWQRIVGDWGELKQQIQRLSPAESFERHTTLIGEVLYLISDTADRSHLSAHPEPSVAKIIYISFNLLPPIIEEIGQARGIGSGAAAKGKLATNIRTKLQFLHERLGINSGSAYSTIERSIQQIQQCQINRSNIHNSQQQTQSFLETLALHILGDQITIAAGDFFNAGTTAFNANLTLLADITATLEQQITGMIPRLKSTYSWSITLATGGAVVLLLLGWQVAGV